MKSFVILNILVSVYVGGKVILSVISYLISLVLQRSIKPLAHSQLGKYGLLSVEDGWRGEVQAGGTFKPGLVLQLQQRLHLQDC